eukprot:TRINITY_DN15400_c0_g1_i1.p1 TRINITY_DN15400_c0_g1~~TRINITY_DN15400_c0_g1_i1.p1  ORF type:complete len:478 (-),score=7.85 TRINITY_DN15400_c0_g1_i1:181-1551(-)
MARFSKHSQALLVGVEALLLVLTQRVTLVIAQQGSSWDGKVNHLRGAPHVQDVHDMSETMAEAEENPEDDGRRLRCMGYASCPDGWVDQTEGFAYWYDCASDCPVIGYASKDCECACVPKSDYVPNLWGGKDKAKLVAAGKAATPELLDCIKSYSSRMRTSRTTAAPDAALKPNRPITVDLNLGSGSQGSSREQATTSSTTTHYTWDPVYRATEPKASSKASSAEDAGESAQVEDANSAGIHALRVSVYVVSSVIVLMCAFCFVVATAWCQRNVRVIPEHLVHPYKPREAPEDAVQTNKCSGRHWIDEHVAHNGLPDLCPSTSSTAVSSRCSSKFTNLDAYGPGHSSHGSDKSPRSSRSRSVSPRVASPRCPSVSATPRTSNRSSRSESPRPRTARHARPSARSLDPTRAIAADGRTGTPRTSNRSSRSESPRPHSAQSARSQDPTRHRGRIRLLL